MKTLTMLITLNLAVFAIKAQEPTLAEGWKFSEGDNLNWAKPGFDDSKWQPINANMNGSCRDINVMMVLPGIV